MEEAGFLSGDALAEDKRLKKLLLLDTITKQCASSPHEVLQKINQAINVSGDGSTIEAIVLSGGYTNFSYKVYVNKHPELCVFAKLCFEYGAWSPDKSAHFDLQRVENEYKIMENMSKTAPGTVVTPLALCDVCHEGEKMKMLVTEWSKGDEQFCNQFIDGAVDPRIAAQIAVAFANLHSIEGFDPDFNANVKQDFTNLHEQALLLAHVACQPEKQTDRTREYCVNLGEDVIINLLKAHMANYQQRDCLIHGDSHVFNILVEAKSSIEDFDEFGPCGTFVLCDWEMSSVGLIGLDVGLTLTFPMGCMIAHALHGQSEACNSIKVFIDTLLDTYCSRMTQTGKTRIEMACILRNIAGTCGNFMFVAFYMVHAQDFFPVEAGMEKDYLWDAVGILGLNLMRVAYDTNFILSSSGLDDIRDKMMKLLEEEVNNAQSMFASRKSVRRQRKSSVLRATNRRVSDTEMLYLAAESVRRLTLSRQDVKQISSTEDNKVLE